MHALHEQQKDCGVFASAREIDDISIAHAVRKLVVSLIELCAFDTWRLLDMHVNT